ncbi:MAG: hypothetical protein ACI8XV_002299, partial [Arenicella sp.]
RDLLLNTPGVELVNQFGTELRVLCDSSLKLEDIRLIIKQFSGDAAIQQVGANLEDVFISLTKPAAEQAR